MRKNNVIDSGSGNAVTNVCSCVFFLIRNGETMDIYTTLRIFFFLPKYSPGEFKKNVCPIWSWNRRNEMLILFLHTFTPTYYIPQIFSFHSILNLNLDYFLCKTHSCRIIYVMENDLCCNNTCMTDKKNLFAFLF